MPTFFNVSKSLFNPLSLSFSFPLPHSAAAATVPLLFTAICKWKMSTSCKAQSEHLKRSEAGALEAHFFFTFVYRTDLFAYLVQLPPPPPRPAVQLVNLCTLKSFCIGQTKSGEEEATGKTCANFCNALFKKKWKVLRTLRLIAFKKKRKSA